MTLILTTGKRLFRYDASVRGDNWDFRNSLTANEVFGKTLVIIGFGRIGRNLARLAQAFGMTVVAYDPYVEPEQVDDPSVRLEPDLHSALRIADYVSIHVPKTEAPILGAAEFKQMKSSAVIINTARGGVVDEAALVEALTAGEIAAAGIDVFVDEPPAREHPLFELDQVVLTPHSASMTVECGERMAVSSARNIVNFFNGKLDSSLVVNADACGLSGSR